MLKVGVKVLRLKLGKQEMIMITKTYEKNNFFQSRYILMLQGKGDDIILLLCQSFATGNLCI